MHVHTSCLLFLGIVRSFLSVYNRTFRKTKRHLSGQVTLRSLSSLPSAVDFWSSVSLPPSLSLSLLLFTFSWVSAPPVKVTEEDLKKRTSLSRYISLCLSVSVSFCLFLHVKEAAALPWYLQSLAYACCFLTTLAC